MLALLSIIPAFGSGILVGLCNLLDRKARGPYEEPVGGSCSFRSCPMFWAGCRSGLPRLVNVDEEGITTQCGQIT